MLFSTEFPNEPILYKGGWVTNMMRALGYNYILYGNP